MWVIEQHATADFETFSTAGFNFNEVEQKWEAPPGATKKGISAVGTAVYAEHPSTEVLTFSYKLPGDLAPTRWRPGLPNPQRLFDWLAAGGAIEFHKAMFERCIWHFVCRRLYGWPELPIKQVRCSMAKARVNNLPGALGNLTAILPVEVRKDADGKRLLDKFSVPRKPTKKDPRLRIRPEDDPEDAEKLYSYCDDDIRAEEGVSGLMMPMTAAELQFWQLDQEMNWRGIGIDREAVRNMIAVLEQAFVKYGEEFRIITGGLNHTQVQATQGWLRAHGVHLDALEAEAIEEALKRPNLPPHCRRVLEIRGLIGSASVKKLYAMERSASSDNRVRDVIIHHGARTGRPTGDLVQPLNLPKAGPDLIWCEACGCPSKVPEGSRGGVPLPPATCPWCAAGLAYSPRKYKWGDLPKGMDGVPHIDFVQSIMATRSLEQVEHYFGDAILAISGCVRGMIVADPGKELIASDYSAIEAVVTAELAGCQWRIDAFRESKDIYLVSCAAMGLGLTYEQYMDYYIEHGRVHHPHRQKKGKVCLGRQTQVLTDKGYLAIVDVTINDKLWDGVEWVKHEGLLDQGVKSTMLLDGVHITPDHLVNLNGSWTEAEKLSTDELLLTRALATGSENLPPRVKPKGEATGSMLRKLGVLAAPRRIGWLSTICGMVNPRGAIFALKKRLRCIVNNIIATPKLYPMMTTGGVYSIEYLRQSRDVTIRRLDSTEITAAEGYMFVKSGETTGRLSFGTSKLSRVGMYPLLKWTERTIIVGINRATFGLFQSQSMPSTKEQFEITKPFSNTTRCVYDLANAGPRRRFTIKSASGHLLVHNCELALGFGGWVGAWLQFDPDGDEATIKSDILKWRAASPEIVEMWGGQARGRPWDADYRLERFGFEGAFVNAVQYPGYRFSSHGIDFYMRGDSLIIRLLSGRELVYHEPRLLQSERGVGLLDITYMTWNSNPKYGPPGWGPMKTYSGRLAENIVQATAHDIQRFGILALEAAGYPIILHVYDENVGEVPVGWGSLEEFERVMATMPPWAADWPIRASGGWRGRRYRKG